MTKRAIINADPREPDPDELLLASRLLAKRGSWNGGGMATSQDNTPWREREFWQIIWA